MENVISYGRSENSSITKITLLNQTSIKNMELTHQQHAVKTSARHNIYTSHINKYTTTGTVHTLTSTVHRVQPQLGCRGRIAQYTSRNWHSDTTVVIMFDSQLNILQDSENKTPLFYCIERYDSGCYAVCSSHRMDTHFVGINLKQLSC